MARLHKCWKEGRCAEFTALLHKLIQLRDNDFGPCLEAFAMLEHDIILRYVNHCRSNMEACFISSRLLITAIMSTLHVMACQVA